MSTTYISIIILYQTFSHTTSGIIVLIYKIGVCVCVLYLFIKQYRIGTTAGIHRIIIYTAEIACLL